MLWSAVIALVALIWTDHIIQQREGTAVRSLATGFLQEIESFTGSERQRKEDIIKIALGSMFLGEASYPWMRQFTWHLVDMGILSWFGHSRCFSQILHSSLSPIQFD